MVVEDTLIIALGRNYSESKRYMKLSFIWKARYFTDFSFPMSSNIRTSSCTIFIDSRTESGKKLKDYFA